MEDFCAIYAIFKFPAVCKGITIFKPVCVGNRLFLNLPIIVFAGEEAFRAKEAKSDKYDASWGEYNQRAVMWEIATAAPMISAGANIVVLWHPKSISTLKGVLV